MRTLASLDGFPRPDPRLEQVRTPPEAAAELLEDADHRGDLLGRSVLDLGCGTGVLSIGARLLGADPVTGVDVDPDAIRVAKANATTTSARVAFEVSDVAGFERPADTVLLNPPFGAQKRHADRPFWDRAIALAQRAVYGFSLEESRTFIAQHAVERGARIEATRPVRWEFPRTFPHHRRNRMELGVDLWVLRVGST